MRLVVISFIWCLSSVVLAAEDASSLIAGGFESHSKEVRQEIAQGLKDRLSEIMTHIREPTPQEKEWIHSQEQLASKHSGSLQRHHSMQLYQSVPFQLTKIHHYYSGLDKNLECILIKASSKNQEMYCWAKVMHFLSDRLVFADGLKILNINRIIPPEIIKKSLYGHSEGIADLYSWYAQGINEYILIPHLDQARLKEAFDD